MATLIFSKSGAPTVTFSRGRIFPIAEPININQRRNETESMRTKVISYGSQSNFIRVALDGLPKADYDEANGLRTFLEDPSVNWSANTFTMTDETGVARTVRFWQDTFQMEEVAPNRYRVNILLKVEG